MQEHAVCMDSPGYVWLLSHNSWFCLASTTRLIQIRNGAEHRISFLLLNSLHGFSPGFAWILSRFCVASFPQLLVLCRFHNSLISNPKQSGTLDFILTFEQFAWILSWFCVASFLQLLVLRDFHNLINTNPKWNGTSDFILTFVQEQFSVSYGTRTSNI